MDRHYIRHATLYWRSWTRVASTNYKHPSSLVELYRATRRPPPPKSGPSRGWSPRRGARALGRTTHRSSQTSAVILELRHYENVFPAAGVSPKPFRHGRVVASRSRAVLIKGHAPSIGRTRLLEPITAAGRENSRYCSVAHAPGRDESALLSIYPKP